MLIAVVGATGTGKSALSLELAEAIRARGGSAEIVNADAMQLYRGMDIGTAKLPVAGRRGIRHHLLDVLDVLDEASVADYQVSARATVTDILGRGAVPILVGGSGLYVSSVLFDFRFPGTDAAVREPLEAQLAEHGPAVMHAQLDLVDPRAAAAIGPHNGRRLVRALEVIELTGEPFGSGLPNESSLWTATMIVGLTTERAELVPRLNGRVERMWRDGLLGEVESLIPLGLRQGPTAGRAIGYSQAIRQLDGRMTEEEAIAETQALTRRYARRQVGWFRRYRSARWFETGAEQTIDEVLAEVSPGAVG